VAPDKTNTARRFGSKVTKVPNTTTNPPSQIHFTSGFKNA
jgi:hypothetical protein